MHHKLTHKIKKKMLKVIITKLSENEITERKIRTWPIWTKEISRFY